MIFQLVDKVVDTIAAPKVILAVHNEYFRAIFFGTGAKGGQGWDCGSQRDQRGILGYAGVHLREGHRL